MRKTAAVIAIITLIVAGAIGCKKLLKKIFPGLDTEVPEIVVTIPYFVIPPGIPVPDFEIPFPAYTQQFNLDSTVRDATGGTFNANDVTSVKIRQIVFTVQNPDSLNNFSNFKSARFTFQSNSDTVPLPIASFTFPDTYIASTTFVSQADSPELISYLAGSELTYNVYGVLRRFTTKALNLSVIISIKVK